MPSPQLRHPHTVAAVSCGHCKQAQVVQILAQTGFWLRARQSVKCYNHPASCLPPFGPRVCWNEVFIA
jgi:hypothetical protein